MRGYNFGGAKAQAIKKRLGKMNAERLLSEFADHIAEGCSPSEAAFRAGAKREDGHKLLDRLRKRVGLSQAV